MAALKIIDRGDLKPADMIGSWAGELGQTQFLPSHYLKHEVDFDGDGRRDLLNSAPDVVASTAAFIESLAGSVGNRGSKRCACPPISPGIRPISPSSIRARNGRNGA